MNDEEKKQMTIRDYYLREKALYKKPNKVKCFFSALDYKLEGNKLYDWYWEHVWLHIWRACYANPKERRNQRKYNKQRIKYGVSEQDCWSIPDWLLETMYHALQNFVLGEYGPEPIRWKEHNCEQHSRRLYNQIRAYREEYERLTYIRERLQKFDFGNQKYEEWGEEYRDLNNQEYAQFQKCCKMLGKLLANHLEVLWW